MGTISAVCLHLKFIGHMLSWVKVKVEKPFEFLQPEKCDHTKARRKPKILPYKFILSKISQYFEFILGHFFARWYIRSTKVLLSIGTLIIKTKQKGTCILCTKMNSYTWVKCISQSLNFSTFLEKTFINNSKGFIFPKI